MDEVVERHIICSAYSFARMALNRPMKEILYLSYHVRLASELAGILDAWWDTFWAYHSIFMEGKTCAQISAGRAGR